MRLESRSRRPGDVLRWLACLGALLLIGACWAALHGSGISVCVFHRLTGLPCLTCGSTRALAALAAGDVAGAFRQQPLAVAAALALGPALPFTRFFSLRRGGAWLCGSSPANGARPASRLRRLPR